MKIIKRSGTEVVFDIDKIVNAIRAANLEVEESSRLTDRQVVYAAQNVAEACENAGHTVSVEEIQDLVEDEIMRLDCYEVARHYIIYRYVQSLKRQKNTTDDKLTACEAPKELGGIPYPQYAQTTSKTVELPSTVTFSTNLAKSDMNDLLAYLPKRPLISPTPR